MVGRCNYRILRLDLRRRRCLVVALDDPEQSSVVFEKSQTGLADARRRYLNYLKKESERGQMEVAKEEPKGSKGKTIRLVALVDPLSTLRQWDETRSRWRLPLSTCNLIATNAYC